MLLIRFLFLTAFLFAGCSGEETDVEPTPEATHHLLVFYKTSGFYHASIPAGLQAIQKLGKENGFLVDTTNNAVNINPENLAKYHAVLFLSTTGDILNNDQQNAFEAYIRSGKGFVGVHAATDAEYNWPWYNKLIGAYFKDHPAIQPATVNVIDQEHLSTKNLPATWQRTDEWYNFKDINPDIIVLATLNEQTYTGGTHGNHHPIVWYHEYDGGRAFYTAGGHTTESFAEPLFLKHLLGGIQYALGVGK